MDFRVVVGEAMNDWMSFTFRGVGHHEPLSTSPGPSSKSRLDDMSENIWILVPQNSHLRRLWRPGYPSCPKHDADATNVPQKFAGPARVCRSGEDNKAVSGQASNAFMVFESCGRVHQSERHYKELVVPIPHQKAALQINLLEEAYGSGVDRRSHVHKE